jgi:hypothetical protein
MAYFCYVCDGTSLSLSSSRVFSITQTLLDRLYFFFLEGCLEIYSTRFSFIREQESDRTKLFDAKYNCLGLTAISETTKFNSTSLHFMIRYGLRWRDTINT